MTPARIRACSLAALAGLVAAPATAQNALGDGRVLDANPSVHGGRLNVHRPSFNQELQFRNAIATGNAPGGLSFRGDLGYRAPGEFTGDLGSDELFAFRRDSLTSGLAGMGIRGTDALQYQFSLTTGARPPRNLLGNVAFTRDSQYQTGAEFTGLDTSADRVTPAQPTYVDTRGLGLYQPSAQEIELIDSLIGTLRSSSSYTSTTNLSPVLLSTFEQGFERQPYGLTSSVLTGVTAVPLRPDLARQTDPRAQPQRPGMQQPAQPGTRPGQPGAAQPGQPGQPGQAGQSQAMGAPRDPSAPRNQTAYEQVVERLRQRAAEQAARADQPGASSDAQSILDRLDAVRQGMMGPNTAPADQTGQPNQQPDQQPGQQAQPGLQQPGQPPSMPTPPGARPAATPGAERDERTPRTTVPSGTRPSDMQRPQPDGEAPQARRDGSAERPAGGLSVPDNFTIDPITLELLRGDGAPLPAYVDPNAETRDLYNEHMRAGERLIGAERYFDAEERFARALAVRPGDPTAQIGRAHAQLGAGLLLSAAVNMRTLFVTNPEILGAKYAGRLLPSPERIDLLIGNLQERAGITRVPGRPLEEPGTRVAAGMLLAYLGYQNDRPEIIESGLGVMREAGGAQDARTASILHQVWMPEPAAEPAPGRPSDQSPEPGGDDR